MLKGGDPDATEKPCIGNIWQLCRIELHAGNLNNLNAETQLSNLTPNTHNFPHINTAVTFALKLPTLNN